MNSTRRSLPERCDVCTCGAKFVSSLLNGKQLAYKDLLIETAKGAPGYDFGQDALRVVDGELANTYKATTKIAVTAT